MNKLGCPNNWLRAGHKCYKFNTGASHTWQESSDACRRTNSRLLQITTKDQKVNQILIFIISDLRQWFCRKICSLPKKSSCIFDCLGQSHFSFFLLHVWQNWLNLTGLGSVHYNAVSCLRFLVWSPFSSWWQNLVLDKRTES